MRKTINIIIVLAGLILGCNNKPPIIIDSDLLKYEWKSKKSEYDYGRWFFIENDTLMFQTLTYLDFVPFDHVVPYKISYDTLFITSEEDYPRRQRIFKYKIIEVDSVKLILKQVFPPSWDTIIVLNKQIRTKKNDFKIERIDFYSGHCFGTCPVQSLSIGADSVMYYNGYYHTKHEGLYKHKLSPDEFSGIQNRLNYIDRYDFELPPTTSPDVPHYRLFIKTPNDSIEISGTPDYPDDELGILSEFIFYLRIKERFLNLTPLENEEFPFRYNSRWGGY